MLQETQVQAKMPNVKLVSNLIDTYLTPYLQSLQLAPISAYRKRIEPTTPLIDVEKVINAKVEELKPFLQDIRMHKIDEEYDEDKLELEGDDETTIIEFVPNSKGEVKKARYDHEPDIFKTNIQKYKEMRNKIKVALEKESVSSKTKDMVIRTLDNLISKSIRSNCDWNINTKQELRGNNICTINNVSMSYEECKKYLDELELELLETETDFSNAIGNATNELINLFQEAWIKNSASFVNKITNKISNILNHSLNFFERYRVRCSVLDNGGRRAGKKYVCDDFRLCSDELKEYLTDFYASLNNTAVSAFRSYAAMYVRDVNTDDSNEKTSVIGTVDNLSNIIEVRVNKAFIKHTSKIKLDKFKNKVVNVKAIKDYVKNTVRHVNSHLKKHLEDDLSSLRARLQLAVKQDINTNLDVDLGNLETSYVERVCNFFVTCNGEVVRSHRKRNNVIRSKNGPDSVYVKVELSLDDDLKNAIAQKNKEILKAIPRSSNDLVKHVKFHMVNNTIVKATRTTLLQFTAASVKDIISSEDSYS